MSSSITFLNDSDLKGCFIWSGTPQGGSYWRELDGKICELRQDGFRPTVRIIPDKMFEL